VIVGGENGPGARPMHLDWVRSMRDQCAEAGVKFHFKGWGGWSKTSLLDGRTHDDMPEVKL
jgi:protein gp37